MAKLKNLILIVLTGWLVVSCNNYSRMTKTPDFEAKEKFAKQLYDKKKYARALPLYEELITVYRGSRKAEELYYYYAYCNFGVGDYLLANYWFDYFAHTYPFSAKAEECEYMAAYCFYKESPREPLEQTSTINAIQELQSFIDAHPRSERVQECNILIDKLRKKLENKDYRNAIQFFNMEYYQASIVSFMNILKDYPETDRRPEVANYIVKASYLYAVNSVKAKRKERLLISKAHYEKYCSKLKDDKFTLEAKGIYDKVMKELAVVEAEEKVRQEQENKLYTEANTYYLAKNYKVALDIFQTILKEYPETLHKVEVSYYLIEGSYASAMIQEKGKKKKKLVDAKNNYTKFASNLKGTAFEKYAATILGDIESELAKLETDPK